MILSAQQLALVVRQHSELTALDLAPAAAFTVSTDVSVVVAVLAATVVYLASYRTLRGLTLGNPPLLAGCIAGLTFLALATQPTGAIGVILIPYAALGLTLLLLPLLLLLHRWIRRSRNRHGLTDQRSRPHPPRTQLNGHKNKE
jgi:hypothetical protein